MAIEKWQSFGNIRDFDDLFNRFIGTRPTRNTEPEARSIPLDVVQDGDSLVVTASVPGTTKDGRSVGLRQRTHHQGRVSQHDKVRRLDRQVKRLPAP